MPDRVAVTGSAGFIGTAVTRRLEESGVQVVGIDRANGDDILTADLREILYGCDSVIHLAGILGTAELFDRVDEAIAINIGGTHRVLEACRDIEAGFVGISMHEFFPSIYTATKSAAHRLASAFNNAYDVPVCHVRAYNAYGPGQAHGPGHPRKIIPAFSCEGWANQPLTVWGDGTQTVDLIHTSELARLLVEATAFGHDQVIEAGTGHPIAVNDIAELVIAVTGSTAGIDYQPMRRGEVPSPVYATGEGWDLLTIPPQVTPGGLEATIRSYELCTTTSRS